jgi:signal transduction histidine kinase
MLMVVNPGIEVYVLDSAAQVRSYLGEPGAVREPRVDMGAMNAFLSGAPLPLLGSDPKAPGAPKIFSVAPFPRTADGSTPGYLYVVLNGEARTRVAAGIGTNRVWQTTLLVGAAGLLVTLSIGLMTFHTLTRPLRRVAGRMRTCGLDDTGAAVLPVNDAPHDEVRAIEQSFEVMAARIVALAQAEHQGAHREVIANVAHDLRTPLTALHGYLETLSRDDLMLPAGERHRYFGAALAQSDKVRRRSQQLFELARLQSASEVLQRDCFRLDELVHDTVQKFELSAHPPPVTLTAPLPGRSRWEAICN